MVRSRRSRHRACCSIQPSQTSPMIPDRRDRCRRGLEFAGIRSTPAKEWNAAKLVPSIRVSRVNLRGMSRGPYETKSTQTTMTHERRRCRGDQYGESRESGRGEYTWVTENDLMAWISIVNGIADEQVGAGGKCDSRASRIGKPLPNDPRFTSWAPRMAVWMQPQSATAEVGHTTFASQGASRVAWASSSIGRAADF